LALLAVLGLGTMLVAFYRVPWGGSFNQSAAGPVSGWVGDLFTALGILGLIYQVSQLRLSRVDETTREINSLYIRISTKAWQRNKVVAGSLVYVYLQNDGERKAMDIDIIVDSTREPVISVGWTDPWRRRVQMTNNMPSSIIDRNA
jgi:hypothetical protein